ncbi:MAG: ABC transporter ATP-binding protein [bacterium]|nr:ABC transporter ATP-binding protein [bacterium]
MKKVISIEKLVKKYGKLAAVDGISFDVYQGEIFGLLGENGAGKTTTLEIIEGLRKPTSGKISILGHDIRHGIKDIKEQIGVQLQSSAYYNFLTLREILELFASFYSTQMDPLKLLQMVHLEEKSNSYVNSLSGGQKQRFSIVASLVNDPQIVFLDEPTTGLDPLARRNLWQVISDIKAKGKTIILTTHYMEEAEALCDRVAIMEKGKILTIGETHKLVGATHNPYRINFITKKINTNLFNEISKFGEIKNLIGKANNFELRLKTQKELNQVLPLIQQLDPEGLIVGRSTLEDLFIQLTGKTIGE